jgi:putative tryptophan/tyrosine transport system substrate-binding protein
MKRREFITLLGGASAALPIAVRAQQGERMRRIGVLMGWSDMDLEYRARLAAFQEALAKSGWVDGQNLRIDVRWTLGDLERTRFLAKELVDLKPDVILSGATPATAALQRETRTIPIVFVIVSDPVGSGFAARLPQPGANLTGFVNTEATLGGKWLELLKEAAPRLKKVAAMFNPETSPGNGTYYMGSFEAAARALAVEPVVARVHNDAEIENAVVSMGRENAGLMVISDSFMSVHRATIIEAATRHKVPAIYELAAFAREGGLIAYGARGIDLFRRSAEYVDRILRGAKPADLPVQLPTAYELILNLRTAKALGLDLPASMQQLADEVIE